MNRYYIYIAIVLGFSCSSKTSFKTEAINENFILAEVKGKTLYHSEIPEETFEDMNEQDSVAYLKHFTTNWIKEQVLILKASEETESLKEIEIKTEKYKNDLLKAYYEKNALENLELELTEDELFSYYNKNKDYFVYTEKLYEIKYIILPSSTPNMHIIKRNLTNNTHSSFVENYCDNNKKCSLKTSQLKKLSFLTTDLKMPKEEIKTNKAYKFHYIDKNNVLIYNIVSIKNEGQVAPLASVKNDVSKFCMLNKKEKYLSEIEEKTYQKAKNDKIFESYIN